MLSNGASVRDVANHFGVSTQAVYAALKDGRLGLINADAVA